ncbi:hypothetical protein PAXRUDRAFT_21420 [Paxillus rubicundulus Ve08.2h10]|uniref:DNA 3'-5' helicase n=1 Tax=Paxillus rubicundulus Ve08.2h10 TaxID=930991 RepID=A0A0D0CZQ1_9AGAM|nr:hypothetical protein PAXRUDRAFT_21420 [Paxillus rubicundulus Ve08.2h10]
MLPSISDIRKCAEEILGVRPCLWQLKVVEALLKRDQDMLCIAGTGMGKTLTFWMPLLFRPDGIQIIVTPLNMLGKQNATSLAKAGIRAIAVNSETATPLTFQLLHMHKDKMVVIHRSCDQPNIRIGVRKIKYALSSYTDLAFLIPNGYKLGDPPPPKFLVFFDNISDSVNATLYLHRHLPPELQDKIKWFNADMSTGFKEDEVENLVSGGTFGLCTTASFSMGMDVPTIKLVLQWRVTCKIAALWQRFGRAARDKSIAGMAILFTEKEHFDDERAAKAAHWEKRKKTVTVMVTLLIQMMICQIQRWKEQLHQWAYL